MVEIRPLRVMRAQEVQLFVEWQFDVTGHGFFLDSTGFALVPGVILREGSQIDGKPSTPRRALHKPVLTIPNLLSGVRLAVVRVLLGLAWNGERRTYLSAWRISETKVERKSQIDADERR